MLVSWAAADNEPDILGDTTLVTTASVPQRVLSVRLVARAGEGAGHGARDRRAARQRRKLLDAAHDAQRARHRGGRPRHRRPRRAAAARRQRLQARARRAQRAPRKAPERSRIAPHPDRRAAVAGLGARHRRRAHLRQHRLRPRRRGQGPGRRAERGRWNCSTAPAREEASRARASGSIYAGRAAGDRRRSPPHLRRARRADAQGQRRHRHRRDRSRRHAQRAEAARRRASPHARPARDRRRDLQRRPAAGVLQHGLSLAVGARRRLPRPVSDRFRAARPASRRAQAARGEGLPRMEGRAARGLSRDRDPRASLAPARRPHAARRHHAQSAGRRDLSVRRRHREPAPGPPLRRADPRAAARRSTISPKRSRCSAATAGCGCTIRRSPPCGG